MERLAGLFRKEQARAKQSLREIVQIIADGRGDELDPAKVFVTLRENGIDYVRLDELVAAEKLRQELVAKVKARDDAQAEHTALQASWVVSADKYKAALDKLKNDHAIAFDVFSSRLSPLTSIIAVGNMAESQLVGLVTDAKHAGLSVDQKIAAVQSEANAASTLLDAVQQLEIEERTDAARVAGCKQNVRLARSDEAEAEAEALRVAEARLKNCRQRLAGARAAFDADRKRRVDEDAALRESVLA
ncbi:MAG TPA: hypothetical protein VGM05_13075 [Planctomycetaceae bacterium]